MQRRNRLVSLFAIFLFSIGATGSTIHLLSQGPPASSALLLPIVACALLFSWLFFRLHGNASLNPITKSLVGATLTALAAAGIGDLLILTLESPLLPKGAFLWAISWPIVGVLLGVIVFFENAPSQN